MLELAILGLLKQQPMHGYQLSRELGESLGGFWRVSYGSLYPTLRRLERDELVLPVPKEGTAKEGTAKEGTAKEGTAREGTAREGTAKEGTGGRRKTVFGITEQGERAFLELLQETPNDSSTEDTRFRVRLAFFRYLPPETRIRLLERRRAYLTERLSTIDDSLRATRGGADDYTLSLMEHGRTATRSDIEWLDGLILSERTKAATRDLGTRDLERDLDRGGVRSRRTAVLSRKEHTS